MHKNKFVNNIYIRITVILFLFCFYSSIAHSKLFDEVDFNENVLEINNLEEIYNIKTSAKNGNKESIAKIMIIYAQGNGVIKKNEEKARFWAIKLQNSYNNNFDKDLVMLSFYVKSRHIELAILQAKKIIFNINCYNIVDISQHDMQIILSCFYMPLVNILYTIDEKTVIKGDTSIFVSPLLQKDSVFRYYIEYISPIFNRLVLSESDKNDYESFFELANSKKHIWLNAIEKYNICYKNNKEAI